jgi:hypothetical protein
MKNIKKNQFKTKSNSKSFLCERQVRNKLRWWTVLIYQKFVGGGTYRASAARGLPPV